MVGEVLADRYELEELVGTGGMSSVFRAHDRLLDRKVALKILHQHYSRDDDYVERFKREARSVAALSHPNIVTVIDRGEHEERQFIVFEYVEGENLKRMIERRGPAPVANALELAIQIARGLAFAHQQGLIHRDVKPQNVLLNGDGRAKVTDFGIARSMNVQHGMTQTGTVLGTSDYIAPEQAQGQSVDEHTDVYSLGVVLYELLTSEVPFPGENFVAVAMRHINEEPPSVRDKRPDVSLRLDDAIQRAMAKRPEDRFPTMDAFCAELEACLAELQAAGTQLARPAVSRPRRQHRPRFSAWPLIAALVVLAAAVAVGRRAHPPQPRQRHAGRGALRRRRPPPRDHGVRPDRRRRRARRRRAEGDRRQPEHLLDDRELPDGAEPRQGGRRARSSTPASQVDLHQLDVHDVDARADRGDPGGRLAERAVRRGGRRVTDGQRRSGRVHDRRRRLSLLRDLDHAARRRLPQRAHRRSLGELT